MFWQTRRMAWDVREQTVRFGVKETGGQAKLIGLKAGKAAKGALTKIILIPSDLPLRSALQTGLCARDPRVWHSVPSSASCTTF